LFRTVRYLGSRGDGTVLLDDFEKILTAEFAQFSSETSESILDGVGKTSGQSGDCIPYGTKVESLESVVENVVERVGDFLNQVAEDIHLLELFDDALNLVHYPRDFVHDRLYRLKTVDDILEPLVLRKRLYELPVLVLLVDDEHRTRGFGDGNAEKTRRGNG